jgi:hypothetical protein
MSSNSQQADLRIDSTSDSDESLDMVEVDTLEVRLPCRAFRVSYKVAEAAEFSLTTEFLLRLSRLADGLAEDSVGEFFGFSPDETHFVVDYVESAGYVQRKNGRVHLTDSGHGLFAGTDEPALFEVHAREERFDFDLIAFAPADSWKNLTQFEYELPELALGPEDPGEASKRVFKSFSRFFQEFRFKKGGSRLEKQSLYTVDDVQAGQRYSSILPVTLSVRRDDPGFPETSLLQWRTGTELEDRAAILQSCVDFAKGIRGRSAQVSQKAREWLVTCAPEALSRFSKNQVFDADGFFRATARQAGELRIDRQTARVIGHLWTDANRTRFAAAMKYAATMSSRNPGMQIWLRPDVPYWGMTTRLPDILGAVARKFGEGEQEPRAIRAIMIGSEGPSPAFKNVFNAFVEVADKDLPIGLEVFLVPGHVAYVALNTPIGHDEGYPISVGIISFDPTVLAAVQKRVLDLVTTSYLKPTFCDWQSADVLAEIEAALMNPNAESNQPLTPAE